MGVWSEVKCVKSYQTLLSLVSFWLAHFCSSIRAACRRIECFDSVVAEVILEPTLPRVSLYGAVSCQPVWHCNTTGRMHHFDSVLIIYTNRKSLKLSHNFCECFREIILCSKSFTKQKKRVGSLLTVEKVNRHFVKTLTQTLCYIVVVAVVDLPRVCA